MRIQRVPFENHMLRLLIAAALTLVGFACASAQNLPSGVITLIVGAPPGGTADGVGRVLADALKDQLGQTVIVENKGGGSGLMAAQALVRSDPDGSTLLLANTSVLAINPSLYTKLAYDPLKDLAPIGRVATVPIVLVVRPDLGVNSVAELIALAKTKPGQLNYGSAGNATAMHLAGVLFNHMAGTSIQHIPYRGSAPAVTNLLGGQGLHMMFEPAATLLGHIEAGRLKALAVAEGKRSPALPEVPTLAESGLSGYALSQYFGLVAPAGTKPEIIARLNEALQRALNAPEVKQRLRALGADPSATTAQELADFMREEIPRWREVVELSGAKLD